MPIKEGSEMKKSNAGTCAPFWFDAVTVYSRNVLGGAPAAKVISPPG